MQTVDILYPALNYPVRERIDPLIGFLTSSLGGVDGRAYIGIQILLIFFGLAYFFSCTGVERLRAGIAGALTTLVWVTCVGVDAFLLKLHWLPLFAGLLIQLRSDRVTFIVPSVIIGTLLAISSGAFGPFVFLFAIFLVVLFAKNPANGLVNSVANEVKPYWLYVSSLLFFACLIFLPVYDMSAYPSDSRLVPLSPLSFDYLPLIGPKLIPVPISFQDLTLETARACRSLSVFMLLSLLVVFGKMRRQCKSDLSLAYLLGFVTWCVTLGFVYLDASDSSARVYSLVSVLARIIPGVALVQVPQLFIPFGFIIGMTFYLQFATQSLLTILLSVIAVFAFFNRSVASDMNHVYPVQHPASLDEYHRSLSSRAVQYFGDWVISPGVAQTRLRTNMQELTRNVDFKFTVQANPLPEEASEAMDGSKDSRWRTGRPQQGGEFFLITFDTPVSIDKVWLSVASSADFPRGIDVYSSADGVNFQQQLHFPDWLGPVRWTDEGLPYMGPQDQVEFDFPKTVTARALKFVQTGSDPRYDWSIHEINFYQIAKTP